MNLAQQIYLKAAEAAAKTASLDLTPHQLATKELEVFMEQGHDAADYGFWKGIFTEKRAALRTVARNEAERINGLSNMRMPSEMKSTTPPAATASAPANGGSQALTPPAPPA